MNRKPPLELHKIRPLQSCLTAILTPRSRVAGKDFPQWKEERPIILLCSTAELDKKVFAMFEIRLLKCRDIKQEFLDLFPPTYGHEMSSELWEWKYIQNPFAVGNPEIVAALNGGKVVGFDPFLPAEMWINHRKVKVAQPIDLMVNAEYRRHGLFRQMNQFAIQYFMEQGCALFYNFPSTMAEPGFLKQGWRLIMSNIENLFQPLNARNVISYHLNSRPLGLALGYVYEVLHGRKKDSSSPTAFQIQVCDHFTPELNEHSLRDDSGINLVRSEEYMTWRFDEHPKHKYKYIIAREGDEVRGYAITTIQEPAKNYRRGMIVDYLMRDDSLDCFRALMAGCIDQLQECDVISIWASSPRFRAALIENLGFKTSLGFPYREFVQDVHFVAREVDTQALGGFDIYDKDNWRVTAAYGDWI